MSTSSLADARHHAQVAMRSAADDTRRRANALIERVFIDGNSALLAATSTAEIEQAERCLTTVLTNLEGAFDALDR